MSLAATRYTLKHSVWEGAKQFFFPYVAVREGKKRLSCSKGEEKDSLSRRKSLVQKETKKRSRSEVHIFIYNLMENYFNSNNNTQTRLLLVLLFFIE